MQDKNVKKHFLNALKRASAIAKEKGEPLNVIGHSWGSVISHDTMKENKIEVDNLITMGSPLPLTLNPTQFDKPKAVKKWMNILSGGDFISGRSSLLEADKQVDLLDVGHTDYWSNDRVIEEIVKMLELKKRNEEKYKKKGK
jgi:alpha-beta hydrolase superfamily lysophospholipase